MWWRWSTRRTKQSSSKVWSITIWTRKLKATYSLPNMLTESYRTCCLSTELFWMSNISKLTQRFSWIRWSCQNWDVCICPRYPKLVQRYRKYPPRDFRQRHLWLLQIWEQHQQIVRKSSFHDCWDKSSRDCAWDSPYYDHSEGCPQQYEG